MKNKNIIAIETSTELISVSIKYKNKIYTKKKIIKKKNNQYILEIIKSIIKKNKIKKKKINIIIINKKPGSLIGIRISTIIAQTFKIKYPKIKIIKMSYPNIVINYLKSKYTYIYMCMYIIILKNINNIKIYTIIKNKKKIKKFNSLKKCINKLKLIKKKYIYFVNNKQLKKKINKIWKKKIYILYPKSKYMILNYK